VSVIAAVITVGVYGLVAGIVKLDDVGMHLMEKTGETRMVALQNRLGEMILSFAPVLMKTLSVLGTAAMVLVGGGIIAHRLPLHAVWHHDVEDISHALPVAKDLFSGLASLVFNGITGIVAGGILVGAQQLIKRLKPKKA
jgi:predicted DNA repair protein MutK